MMAIAAISPGAAPVRRRAFVAEAMCPRRKEPRGGLHERRSAGGAGRLLVFFIDARSRRPEPVCNGAGTTIFRRRPEFFVHRATRDGTLQRGGFASRSKIVAPRHPPLCSGPCGCKPSPPPAGDRREGRDGRG